MLYLEIVRLAYNLVTAFQRTCLEESWQHLTLQRLRYKLFVLPGERTRPQAEPAYVTNIGLARDSGQGRNHLSSNSEAETVGWLNLHRRKFSDCHT